MSGVDNEQQQQIRMRPYRLCSCGVGIKWAIEQSDCLCGMDLKYRQARDGRLELNVTRATDDDGDYLRRYNIDRHEAPYPVNCFTCPLKQSQKCNYCDRFGEHNHCAKNDCGQFRRECCLQIEAWHEQHPDYWRDSFAKLQRLLRGIEKKSLTREDIEERAAILEYDGGLIRAEAERRARAA
jgi:hypothetical protein